MEFVERTIYGTLRYKCEIDEHVVYCEVLKNQKEICVDFIVGLPGASPRMKKAEEYRLGIEGCINSSNEGKMLAVYFSDVVFVNYYDGYGRLLKKMLWSKKGDKYYIYDNQRDGYYEVSASNVIGPNSDEKFVIRGAKYKKKLEEKDRFEEIFMNIFEAVK